MPVLSAAGPGAGITFRWTNDYRETYGPDGVEVTATVHTAWTEDIIQRFPAGMIGTAKNQGGSIQRFVPFEHPTLAGVYCTACNLTGGIGYVTEATGNGFCLFATDSTYTTTEFGTSQPVQPHAVWSLTFGHLGYKVKTDQQKDAQHFIIAGGNGAELIRNVSRKSKTALEALPVPGTEWKWSSDNAAIYEPSTIQLTVKELEYVWHWVPLPYKESTWDGLLGRVNSDTFDGVDGHPSYAVETVYFAGYDQSDPVTDPQGNICRHVTFRFMHRPTGWNKYYRPGSGFVGVVASGGGGTKPFTPDTLMKIFN